MADAPDLESGTNRCEGSSPFTRTKQTPKFLGVIIFLKEENNMKEFKKSDKKIITGALVLLLVVIGLCTKNESIITYLEKNYDISLKEESNDNKVQPSKMLAQYEVLRVVDGDTIVINYNGNAEKVRLIGIDTPESVHPDNSKNTEEGIKTSNYTKQRLTGKTVGIELDVQERDKYGRILAYVYVDGKMYNKELLELGYAKVATYPPNVKYVEEFTKIQEKARENKVGLWK